MVSNAIAKQMCFMYVAGDVFDKRDIKKPLFFCQCAVDEAF
jgi:hypothetical protein